MKEYIEDINQTTDTVIDKYIKRHIENNDYSIMHKKRVKIFNGVDGNNEQCNPDFELSLLILSNYYKPNDGIEVERIVSSMYSHYRHYLMIKTTALLEIELEKRYFDIDLNTDISHELVDILSKINVSI